jgi:hypothetical protein
MSDTTPEQSLPPTPIDPAPAKLDPLVEIKAKLTEEEKEHFFKAFLADKPYIASESLFNGKIPVKFSSLSIKENNTVLLQMQYDRESGVAKNNDAYLIKVIQYRIAASLLEINNTPFAPDITDKEFPNNEKEHSTYILKRLSLMDNWGVYKISSLTEAFNRFESKLRALTEESFKGNF